MIYLDHNATTPVDARVLEAMLPWLRTGWGNPSSVHTLGRRARAALEQAREQVAALVGAHPSQVIFTSGGTEANNMALKGVAARLPARAPLAASAVEHASVQQPLLALARSGHPVAEIGVSPQGQIERDALEEALRGGARLVSVMWANNETGIIHDIPRVAEHVREAGAFLHTDAVQACGKLALDFAASGAHLMSLSAHKLNGPKGVGALLWDKSVDMEPLLHGGGQEKGLRGGTENLASIIGFGVAAELAQSELAQRAQHALTLRRRLEQGLAQRVGEAVIFGAGAERLPNTVFLALPGIEGESLLLELDRQGLAVSSGAACGSGYSEPSHVLRAMGVDIELAHCAVRISLGAGNTAGDVDALIDALQAQAACMQRMASAW